MKKGVLRSTAVIALLLSLFGLIFLRAPVKASAASAYSYTVERYDVTAEVHTDCTIAFTEVIRVSFSGYDSHGIIRDFPLGGGVRYTDFSATCDNSDFSPYFETDEEGVLSWYLRGESRVRGQTRTYTLQYTVHGFLTDGVLPIDILGYQMPSIEEYSARVILPEGFVGVKVYSGREGATTNQLNVQYTQEGNTLLFAAQPTGGITINLTFEDGIMGRSVDFAFLWGMLLGVVVVGIAICLKVFVCKQRPVVRSVNLSAPDEMDPLRMGKLIDNKVDGEDMGALVFWLASEGYLRIDLTQGEDDPILHRTEKPLPADIPGHVKLFYEGLFRGRESVRVSWLTNKFYTTADAVRASVDASAGNLYAPRGKKCIAVVGVLCVLLLGVFFLLYGLMTVGYGYLYWIGILISLFSFLIGSVGGGIAAQRRFKWKRAACVGTMVGMFLLGCLPGVIAFIMVPAYTASLAVWLTGCLSSAAGTVGGTCFVRTDEYTKKLGHILGFKDFILYTERDKIAKMMEIDPELYYKILPYAQVLGVTNVWTDKFKGLNMPAPTYMSCSGSFVFRAVLFHHISSGFSRAAISRPSTHGKGGGGHGGGHGGRGFGGGGMRGC